MKPPVFTYHRPATLDECVGMLSELGDDAALIAGGQNLVPLMRFKLAQPPHVISIAGFASDLPGIQPAGDRLAVGASVTYRHAERSRLVGEMAPSLPTTIELIATPAVRTRGTICGNLCQADPASELPAVALLLDGQFHLRSSSGERVVPAREFLLGPYTTARRPDEILTDVRFRARGANERFVIQEVTRQRGGFPMAGVAAALTVEAGKVRTAAIACFGVHSTALRVSEAEACLQSLGLTDEAIDEAAAAVARAVDPHADTFASAEYRRSAVCTLLKRVLRQARTQESTR